MKLSLYLSLFLIWRSLSHSLLNSMMPWAAEWTDLHRAAAAATIVACLLLATPAVADNDTRCLKELRDSLNDPYGYLNWDFRNQGMGFICSFKGVSCRSQSKNRVLALSLSYMDLSGEIPSGLQYCASTISLDLSRNLIAGEIPAQLCTWLPFLVHLDLSRNQLSGPIPDLSSCKYLYTLNLARNRLSGQIPSALQYYASTYSLDLSGNFITDEIPAKLCTWLPFLVHLDLSRNQLSGPIPDLSSCAYLDTLNLAGNRLSGQIPPTLSLLFHLISLDLSENHLSGFIPVFINSSFQASAFSGNAALCGSPLPRCPISKAYLAIIVVAGISCSARLLLFFYSACRWYLNRSMADSPAVPLVLLVADHQRIRDWVEHPADLAFLEEGDGIAALELVGRGGCGEVYRAQLASKTVAIKKIIKTAPYEEESRLLDRRTRQARSEIITVGRIRHCNLLPLLAHVPRPNCNYLIYEFMNNGSLHDAIVRNNGLRLDWLARYRIAAGIATGLEYLHHHHNPHLIHRDLKPANILLDEDLNARISDFGLAKEFPDAQTHMSMSKVAGTIGYIAPEYYQTLKFTAKCDIYSLGVILAVLVTGKLPSDYFFQGTEEISMAKWLRNVMGSAGEDPRATIDERLLGQGFEEQMVLVLKISCFCTADHPNHRPTSKDVRCMLSQIKH